MKRSWTRWLWLAPPLAAAMVYLSRIPNSIQFGDSAEFLLAASQNSVPHPPGYPLYVLLLRALRSFAQGSDWIIAASALTSLLSVATITVVSYAFRRKILLTVLVPSALAFSFTFWRFSLLPDVFALHIFLTALYIYFFLQQEENNNRLLPIALLFGLGCAHHPSFVLLAPLHIRAFLWQNWRTIFRYFLVSASALTLSYSTILLLNGNSPWSWGDWNGLNSIVAHFFRRDFGAFQLSANRATLQYWKVLALFGKSILFDFGVLFPLLAVALIRSKKIVWDFAKIFLPTLALYLICFFSLLNVDPNGFGKEVVERFFLMPQLLLCFFIGAIWLKAREDKRDFALLAMILFPLWSYVHYRDQNNFSKNRIIEEFAQNVLAQVEQDRGEYPAIVLTSGDSAYFALQFFLAENSNLRISALAPEMLFHSWYQKKVAARSGLDLTLAAASPETKVLLLGDQLLRPNERKFRFYAERSRLSPAEYSLRFLPSAVQVESGKGLRIGENKFVPRITSSPAPVMNPEFDSGKSLYALYAYYGIARGHEAIRRNKRHEALLEFQGALKLVPYAIPALEGICQLTSSSECRAEQERMRKNEYDYFQSAHWN